MHRLLARTEGWAAGLQLAALRLNDRADPSAFIERFTGADWHIVNYLGDKVLTSQPPLVREFLLVTSVLNRMCAPLCDALTGRPDGAELISEIHRANLFLIPLDDERRWFRYHHLFGELLRHELSRTAPERPSALQNGRRSGTRTAVTRRGHRPAPLASGDDSLSRRLVVAHWRQHFNAGQLETVRRWLDALPAELVAVDASLSAARVWVALDTGRLEEVGAALDAAEASGPPDTHLMVLRALHMYKTGDVGGAADRLQEISPSADDPFIATVHRLVQGISSMWLGDADRARELLAEAARPAVGDGNRLAYIYAEGCLALMAVNHGDLASRGRVRARRRVRRRPDAQRLALRGHVPGLGPGPPGCPARDWAGRGGLRRPRWNWAAAAPAGWNSPRPCSPRRRSSGPRRPRRAARDPGTGAAGASDVESIGALVGEARGIVRHSVDPGPVRGLAGREQRAKAACAHGRRD